jgi:hypothetical protein
MVNPPKPINEIRLKHGFKLHCSFIINLNHKSDTQFKSETVAPLLLIGRTVSVPPYTNIPDCVCLFVLAACVHTPV